MPKARRHQILTEILRNGPVPSQDDLAEALSSAGEATTQATISRDLKSLGALKGPAGYTLPEPRFGFQAPPVEASSSSLDQVYATHVHRVSRADNLVVLHTAPGHAQVVAASFDTNPLPGAVGTVAGDDTIFVATTGAQAASKLEAHMLEAAGLQKTDA